MGSVKQSFDLTDKVSVITGGAGMLGEKHAEASIEFGGIPIFLDIDKKSGAMRQCGTDRIRILHKSRLTNHHRRISRINRTGEFKNIQQRVITGIKTAQGL